MAIKPPSSLAELRALEIFYTATDQPKYRGDDGEEVYLHIFRRLFEEIEKKAKNDDEILEWCYRPGQKDWLAEKRNKYRSRR